MGWIPAGGSRMKMFVQGEMFSLKKINKKLTTIVA